MAKDEIRIPIVAEDDASEVIEDVAGAAKGLDGLDVEVGVDADGGDAKRTIADVKGEAEALSREDVEIALTARAGDLKAQLKSAEGALKSVRGEADRTEKAVREVGEGGRIAGNSMADLAGPLGDAEGAASTAGGVFDGLSDIVENMGGKFGLSEAAIGGITGALGLAGFAVAGLAAAWTKYTGDQRKAREEAERMAEAQRDINDALAEGDVASAARAFLKAYPDIGTAARKAGVDVQTLTGFIRGQVDELPELDAKIAAARAAYESFDKVTAGKAGQVDSPAAARARAALNALLDLRGQITGMRDDEIGATGANDSYEAQLSAIEEALGGGADEADRARAAEEALRRFREGTADANIAYEDALADIAAAHDATRVAAIEAAKAVDDTKTPTNEAADANRAYEETIRAERDANINAANAAADRAEQHALAMGATDVEKQRTDALNESLLASARATKGPVHDALVNHIATINGIPPEKVTEILANTPNLAATEEALNNLVRERELKIKLHAFMDKNPETRVAASLIGGTAAAPNGASSRTARGVVPLALAPAAVVPTVNVAVHVDARGALDPYRVGQAVERAAGEWARVAGRWHPGAVA